MKNKIFYGWAVVLAGMMVMLVTMGVRYSYGVFFKSIEGAFDLSRGATSLIFSVQMLFSGLFSALGGWALDRYGPKRVTFVMGTLGGLSLFMSSQARSAWQLVLSYGLLAAAGTGGTYTVVGTTVSRWFDKKRGLALGTATIGGPLGAVVMAPFAAYLISHFGWRWSFAVLGLVSWAVMSASSLLMKADPADMGLFPDGAKSGSSGVGKQDHGDRDEGPGVSSLQAFKTRSFWFLGATFLSLSLSVHLILTHAVPHAMDMGIEQMEAALILSLTGAGGILGRLTIGRASDMIGRRAPAITCALVQAASLLWVIWVRDLRMFYLFAVIFGICWGGLGMLTTALVSDIFGTRKNIGTIMGVALTGWSIGAAFGPALGGFVFDLSGHYGTSFALASGIMLITTVPLTLLRKAKVTGDNKP